MDAEFQYDVFLSHSSDDKEIVRPIAERLRADGLRVWFDEWEIKPGHSIPAKVREGLRQSRMLVFCMSANGFGSKWTTFETDVFTFHDPDHKDRRSIPLRLDDTPVIDGWEHVLYIDWRQEADREQEYAKLLAACSGEIELSSAGEPSATGQLPVGPGVPAIRQHVCMISSEYPPHVSGGLGVHVTRLTQGLTAFADIDLVLPHQKRDYVVPPAGIRTHPMARVEASYEDPISWLHFAQHAFNLLKGITPKPRVIHCHDWVTVLGGIKCRWLLKVPLVFHVHLPNRTPFCSSVENLGLVCADLVTVNSQAMFEQLKDRFPDKEVAVVPNGVDTETFKPGNPATDADPYVFFAGRLVEQKGVDHLLRAFVHVQKRFPKVKLKIAGAGPCKLAYERMADCLLVKKDVDFLGWKGSPELSTLYQGASVVVVPSIYEPFGMTALEAMACARPVVASNTGGLREIIRHGVTGYLAEPGDHLDLAQWIMRLLDRENLRQELGAGAGRLVHESTTYQWPSIARQYAAFYQNLARKTPTLKVPEQARGYVEQICSLAYGLDQTSRGMCSDLFNWMQ